MAETRLSMGKRAGGVEDGMEEETWIGDVGGTTLIPGVEVGAKRVCFGVELDIGFFGKSGAVDVGAAETGTLGEAGATAAGGVEVACSIPAETGDCGNAEKMNGRLTLAAAKATIIRTSFHIKYSSFLRRLSRTES